MRTYDRIHRGRKGSPSCQLAKKEHLACTVLGCTGVNALTAPNPELVLVAGKLSIL